VAHPTEPVTSATPWFSDLRKVALFASIAGALSLLLPLWNGLQTIGAIGAARPIELGLLAISLLATAIMPIFFFALYQNPGPLAFPKHLRLLALIAAIVLTLMVTWGLPQWVRSLTVYFSALKTVNWSLGAASVWRVAADPSTIYHVSTLLAQISNLGLVLLLISIFRHESNQAESEVGPSSTLRIVTKAAVMIWGLWLGFNLIRGILTPYLYLQVRNAAAQAHRSPPRAIDLVADMVSAILLAACWFISPYIVYKSQATSPQTDAAAPPIQEESPEQN
jgi:hypothetical protein